MVGWGGVRYGKARQARHNMRRSAAAHREEEPNEKD